MSRSLTTSMTLQGLFLLATINLFGISAVHSSEEIPEFIDKPLEEPIILPKWFKLSFLDLFDDVEDAKASGKKGIIVYFGQKDCPYCKAHLDTNWGNADTIKYTQKYFDVIALDVKGDRNITTIDGVVYDEKAYSAMHRTNFTPSLLFYNTEGKEVLKLQGYHPPYKFRAALEFVADEHYKKEGFRDYLARAELAEGYGEDSLNTHPVFMPPPYLLDRSRVPAQRPLVVLFEQKRCHACDILHAGPLSHPEITQRLKDMDVVQLDLRSKTKLIRPNGKRSTAEEWAKELDLFYTPTLIIFDEQGKEIIRISSVVWVYRLNNVLNYISTGAYKKYETYQLWRQYRMRKEMGIE
ncbi:MAG: thioredoxin fold domain-containing protein [Gammaproteobacteria bacterium]|nr:thioredoxin fold domain-containing protein [Gammaproteobacteria bacterium]